MVTQFRQLAKAAGMSLAFLLSPVAANAALIPINIDITIDDPAGSTGSGAFVFGSDTASILSLTSK